MVYIYGNKLAKQKISKKTANFVDLLLVEKILDALAYQEKLENETRSQTRKKLNRTTHRFIFTVYSSRPTHAMGHRCFTDCKSSLFDVIMEHKHYIT